MPNPLLNCNFHPIPCNLFPVTEGRSGIEPIIIVLHYLSDTMDAVALNQATTSKRLAKGKRVQGYTYLVDVTGFSAQLQDLEDTVPNLYTLLNPTTTLLDSAVTGIDAYLIHIGLTGMNLPCETFTEAQYWELVRLICCITNTYPGLVPTPETVLLPTAIHLTEKSQEHYDECSIPETLYADAIACVDRTAATPFVNYPFPQDLGGAGATTNPCNEALTQCCTDTRQKSYCLNSVLLDWKRY